MRRPSWTVRQKVGGSLALASLAVAGFLVIFLNSRPSEPPADAATPAAAAGALTPNRFVATNGSDTNPCTAAAPCKSLTRAYEVSSAGDVVQVAGGSYGNQEFDVTPAVAGPDVTFLPAPGAAVTLNDLEVANGAHLAFQDFKVTGDTYNRQGASYITYTRIQMGLLYIRGADHISYIGGSVGPNDANDYMNWITEPYASSDPAQDDLLDGITIHDFYKHNAGSHVDCLGIGNSDRLTIRNSRFFDCEHFAIIPGKDPSGKAARNLVIENNFIECCGLGFYSIGLGDAAGVIIRHNSISGAGIGWLGGTVTGVVIDSNVIDHNNDANCSNATWTHNIISTGNACGGTMAPDGFAAPPQDLHLVPGAAAIDAGCSDTPPTDIDGQARPAGASSDCGADETGATNPPPPTTTAATTTVATTTAQTTTSQTTTTQTCSGEAIYRQALTDLRASTLYASYKKSNPKEQARVDAWLTTPTSTLPAVSTKTGSALVGFGRVYLDDCG